MLIILVKIRNEIMLKKKKKNQFSIIKYYNIM